MKFPNKYKCLNKNVYNFKNYKITPLRYEDRDKIMKWRNEQIYHLRQEHTLSIKDQDIYFKNSVYPLFNEKNPNQILFSFFKDNILIGYGGLVHINWVDKNSEISFLINTELENLYFTKYWSIFLILIQSVAKNINMHKIFTYAYDLRSKVYDVLINQGFSEDGRLRQHVIIDGTYKDVLIHSKIIC